MSNKILINALIANQELFLETLRKMKKLEESEKVEEPKTWEIVSYDGSAMQFGARTPKDAPIKSVRRLSDGVVFTVGDKITLNDWSMVIAEIRIMTIANKDQILFVGVTNKELGLTSGQWMYLTKDYYGNQYEPQHYKEPFQWTDELVLEFAHDAKKYLNTQTLFSELLESFKKQRQ